MNSQNPWGIPILPHQQVRQSFIEHFKALDHQFVRSAPVVPHDDPTLLFTNAGMNQFKPMFLGDNRLGFKRVVNSQKCIRVSGKHNDLDEVGRDTYHHTFFEMLGNWSFGDYYKVEAIKWAWDLLTGVWKLPSDRLFVTVYKSDDEAFEIWRDQMGLPESRIMRFAEKENFWEMGEIGPCGPCTEIHFDLGDPKTQAATFNHPIEGVNGTNARYIEIWNLVFMQYERLQNGDLKPLSAKHVDTGMGFERICSIIQGSGSNYETDIFAPIIEQIAALSGQKYDRGESGVPHRVIADHVRTLAFAIADGATPGNEGRGYVLRRILRRASRFTGQLNQKEPFICRLVPTLVKTMGDAFPEIREREDYIVQVIEAEERRFMKTLDQGLQRLQKVVATTEKAKKKELSGEDVFLLYDTYGFPADLTRVLAEERGLAVDEPGFEKFMTEQRDRARSAAKFDASLTSDESWTILDKSNGTIFCGYEALSLETTVLRYAERGDDIYLVLRETPFYAESGGQVGDIGIIEGQGLKLAVVDTIKVLDMVVHRCALSHGLLSNKGLETVKVVVDAKARANTMRNHSATHLLHSALRRVLGEHVQQQGSRVGPESLRFDFTHHKGVEEREIRQIEDLVNGEILSNHQVAIKLQPIDQAKADGAVALFGEKYGDEVRTIRMGETSYELCGGTHVNRTGDIGSFKITSESSIAAGVRRIEAVSGLGMLELVRRQGATLSSISQGLKVAESGVEEKVFELAARVKDLDKEVKQLQQKQVNVQVDALIASRSENLGKRRCIIAQLDPGDYPKASLQTLLDSLCVKLGDGVAVLTRIEDDTLSIMAAVGTEARKTVKANEIVQKLSVLADGRGGGRPDKAQAGSKSVDKEPLVREEARRLLQQ